MNAYENIKTAYKACFNGDVEALKMCVYELKVSPDSLFFNYAVVKGQISVMKFLIEDMNMYPDKDIFIEAIKRNYCDLVYYLGQYHKFDYDCLKAALENSSWHMVDNILQSGLSLTNECISFIVYGEHIKNYIDYKKDLEGQKEETRNVFMEAQEPF